MALYPQTLGGMKARIIAEMMRPDLAVQIENAINDAILVYQKDRFRFSDIVPNAPPVFNTEIGRWIYTAADNPNISSLFSFDYAFVNIGGTIAFLEYKTPAEIKGYNEVNTSQGDPPGWYSYEGNQFLISPIPAAVRQVTLGVFRRVAAPADDNEANNPWMVDAERLIRARAKFEIATHITRNAKMAQAMSPEAPANNGGVVGAAWREYRLLKGEANKVTGSGQIRAMQF